MSEVEPMTDLRFREDKTTQAASRLLELNGGAMNAMKLVKLLYLADRTSLIRWGRPISFDWYYSMKLGPVLSYTLDCINAQADSEAPTYWQRHISERTNHSVSLRQPAPGQDLSEAEEKVLDEVFAQFGQMDPFTLSQWCHDNLHEWKDPNGGRLPIEIADILRAEGYDDTEIAEVMEGLESEASAARLLR